MFSKMFSSVRYSLAGLNLLFLVTGIILFSVGVSVQIAYNDYYDFLSDRFTSLPSFLIATGVIIFIISAVGFLGAVLQNYYVNLIFVGMMIVVFIFEASACIAGYVLHNNTAALLQKSLLQSMPFYNTNGNMAITILWDEMQRDFECCGVIGATDWPNNLPATENNDIPVSCCPMEYGAMAEFTCNSTNAYSVGCTEAFGEWVSGHALVMGGVGLFICLVQAVTAGAAGWIAKRSKFEDLN